MYRFNFTIGRRFFSVAQSSKPVKKELPLNPLTAISPCDGRYGKKTRALRPYLGEFALIRERIKVEIRWVQLLCGGENFEKMLDPATSQSKTEATPTHGIVKELPLLTKEAIAELNKIISDFSFSPK